VVDADEMMLIKVKLLATKSISGRCCLETFEGSWNSRSHGALRLPVRSVPATQGKGDWQPKDCPGDREGAFSWGGTGMWGMRDRWLEYCRGLNGWSAAEVWYLGLDHVDKDCGPWLSWEAIARWSHSSAPGWEVFSLKR
jgi:hypothetical protein